MNSCACDHGQSQDSCPCHSHLNRVGGARPLEVAASVTLQGFSHQTACPLSRALWSCLPLFFSCCNCGHPAPREALSCWQVAENLPSAGQCCSPKPSGSPFTKGSEGRRAHPRAAAPAATGRASWSLPVALVFFIPSRTHGIWDSINDHFGCLQGTTMGTGEGMCVRILISPKIHTLINTSITNPHQNLCRALQFANYISRKLFHLIFPVALEPWDYPACFVAG